MFAHPAKSWRCAPKHEQHRTRHYTTHGPILGQAQGFVGQSLFGKLKKVAMEGEGEVIVENRSCFSSTIRGPSRHETINYQESKEGKRMDRLIQSTIFLHATWSEVCDLVNMGDGWHVYWGKLPRNCPLLMRACVCMTVFTKKMSAR